VIKPRKRIDVKILTHAPIAFQYEVVKRGEVIFSKYDAKEVGGRSALKLFGLQNNIGMVR